MWEIECETLARTTSFQNVAQLLLTVMNHTGLKWLPQCGIISADCEKLHRTQIASSTITADCDKLHRTQCCDKLHRNQTASSTITADCDKLHRTQMASQNVARLLLADKLHRTQMIFQNVA